MTLLKMLALTGPRKRSAETAKAKQTLRRARMRRALYEILWDKTAKEDAAQSTVTLRPCPYLDDDRIIQELWAILLERA